MLESAVKEPVKNARMKAARPVDQHDDLIVMEKCLAKAVDRLQKKLAGKKGGLAGKNKSPAESDINLDAEVNGVEKPASGLYAYKVDGFWS